MQQLVEPCTLQHLCYGGDSFQEAARLRHDVFCRQLGWIPENALGLEQDRYDPVAAVHLGVYRAGKLRGYARILHHLPLGFMQDTEFRSLLPNGLALPRDQVMEVSRLVTAPGASESSASPPQAHPNVAWRLYKAMYGWSLAHGKPYWLIQSTLPYLRKLRRQGFRFERLGHAVETQPGVFTTAAVMDLVSTEAFFEHRYPERLAWLRDR